MAWRVGKTGSQSPSPSLGPWAEGRASGLQNRRAASAGDRRWPRAGTEAYWDQRDQGSKARALQSLECSR